MVFLRVISGTKKGYKIKAPKGQDTRPTKDRIKESLFNILGDISSESMVLDLYAGSGSIGIEFLSRGACKAYFVDRSYLSVKTIKENLRHTKLEDNSKVMKSDFAKAIGSLDKENIKFNYIFIDPPFGQNLIIKTLKRILEVDILSKDGLIIIEHEKDLILKEKIDSLKRIDYRSYGNECLSFYIQNSR